MSERPVRLKAGVVPVRGEPGAEQVLLIAALSVPGSWIFPTGTVEPGETLQETAVRECREESGVLVELGPRLGEVRLPKPSSVHELTFFLGRFMGETERMEPERSRRWVSPNEAVRLVAEPFRPIAEAARRWLQQERKGPDLI